MHFRLELWRQGGVFHDLEGRLDWKVIVQYDPSAQRYRMVQQQAAMLSFVEAFWIMGVAFLLMLPFLLLLRYTKPAAETAPTVRDQVPELLRPAAQPAVPESASEEPVLVSH